MQIAGTFFTVVGRYTMILYYNAGAIIMFRSVFFQGAIFLAGVLTGCSTRQEREVQQLLRMQQNACDIASCMQGCLNSDRLRFVGSGGGSPLWIDTGGPVPTWHWWGHCRLIFEKSECLIVNMQ